MTDEVDKAVLEVFHISHKELMTAKNYHHASRAMYVAAFFHRMQTGASYEKLARRYNRKDHTSMIHACKRFIELRKIDYKFDEKVRRVAQITGVQV